MIEFMAKRPRAFPPIIYYRPYIYIYTYILLQRPCSFRSYDVTPDGRERDRFLSRYNGRNVFERRNHFRPNTRSRKLVN